MKTKKIRLTHTMCISLEDALKGIRNGIYYADLIDPETYTNLCGFEYMRVDVNAAEFDTDIRWAVQTVEIPEKKTGNLSKYAGKTVEIICTSIARSGARINFYIREKL